MICTFVQEPREQAVLPVYAMSHLLPVYAMSHLSKLQDEFTASRPNVPEMSLDRGIITWALNVSTQANKLRCTNHLISTSHGYHI